MVVVFIRGSRPPATVWFGRRWLAAIDALIWPALWVIGIGLAPFKTGVIGLVFGAAAVCFAARRLLTAVFSNESYRFTTWRWGMALMVLLVVAAVLKLALLMPSTWAVG